MIVLIGDQSDEGLLLDTVECALTSSSDEKIVRLRNVEAKDVYTASYVLERVAVNTPTNTIFLAAVDGFNDSARVPIALMSKDGRIFVGFDNGIFTAVAERFGIRQIRRIEKGELSLSFIDSTMNILVPAVIDLVNGVDFSSVGELYMTYYSLKYHKIDITAHSIEGEVAFLDNGNVETNIPFSLLEKIGVENGDELTIQGKIITVTEDEREKENKELILRKGIGGYAEIISKGNASKILKVEIGEKIILEVLS